MRKILFAVLCFFFFMIFIGCKDSKKEAADAGVKAARKTRPAQELLDETYEAVKKEHERREAAEAPGTE